jgi:polysaccharide pyruvyl transferase WcaK-like protein
LQEAKRKRKKIVLFGHFGQGNFGNESTLQAFLCHLRRVLPNAEVTCICTDTEAIKLAYNIDVVPMTGISIKPTWLPRRALTRLLRRIVIGIPSELYRWFDAFRVLKGEDALIIVGTGLVTDAYGRVSWGPYTVFKWSLAAKLRRCKLLFVSVGVGPIYSSVGGWLIKSVLSWADFRSYREQAAITWLKGIGFQTNHDKVYPDLAFSLPEALVRDDEIEIRRRRIIGLGLMQYAGKLSTERPSSAIYLAYLENLAEFVRWLLAHDYDVRLLIGDIVDRTVVHEFKKLLKERSLVCGQGRIIDEPVSSVDQLLGQIAATDSVVATRFHNVLLALLLNKPVISISFHHKCDCLMSQMELSEYCQNISDLNVDRLIEQFRDLEGNALELKALIRRKTTECRSALDEQYSFIFKDFLGSS